MGRVFETHHGVRRSFIVLVGLEDSTHPTLGMFRICRWQGLQRRAASRRAVLTRVYGKLRLEGLKDRSNCALRISVMTRVQRNILLVEPETMLAEITAFRLELLGYHVDCVASGEEAVRCAGESLPDLLITDLVLPGLDGVGLIERLTTDEKTASLPIMVLSIDADLGAFSRCTAWGPGIFWSFPFHMDVLAEKVARLIATRPERAREPSRETAASVR